MRDELQVVLTGLEQAGQLRHLPSAVQGLDLLSNDYVGIARDTVAYAAFVRDWLGGNGVSPSASASRLLGGCADAAAQVEDVADRVFKRSTLYLNSGYHANIGLLPVLAGKADLIVADKDIHASLIDGSRLSAARLLRYPHQDLAALARILSKQRANYHRVWVVTESVFSMDGSLTDLHQLCALKQKYDVQLYVDEAHAVGLFGDGLGLAHEQGVLADIDVCVMPCAKALASYGALVLSDVLARDYLVNHCRSLIFASALPPIVAAWTAHVLASLPDYGTARATVFANSAALQQALGVAQPAQHHSPIVPLVIGDNHATMQLASALREEGIHVGAVRYPTVAKGRAQLRLCVSATLSDSDIAHVAARIVHHRQRLGV